MEDMSLIQIPPSLLETAKSYMQLMTMGDDSLRYKIKDDNLFYKTNTDMRIYGSSSELAEELDVYRNFPSNYLVIPIPDTEPCLSSPSAYVSLKNEQFFLKTDLIVFLEKAVMNLAALKLNSSAVFNIAWVFLRKVAKKLDRNLEFVKCTLEEVKQFSRIGTSVSKQPNYENGKLVMPSEFHSFEKFWNHFVCEFSFLITEENEEGLKELISQKWSTEDTENDIHDNLFLFGRFEHLLKKLKSKIDSKPQWFTPQSILNDPNSPLVVRLFEDKNYKVIIYQELLTVMERGNIKLDPVMKPCNVKQGIIPTISFREAFNLVKFEKIEFVKCRVNRTNHCAVPIATHDGTHCIPAIDAFMDTLLFIIRIKKIFQLTKDWSVVERFIKRMKEMFNGDSDVFFVTRKLVCKLILFCEEESKKLELPEGSSQLRTIDKTGFTRKDIENELIHLNLCRLFPEITDLAEVVYDKLMESNEESWLRTKDMFYAVENCQIICLLERIPKFKQFVHSQHACHRILNWNCLECPPIVISKRKSVWNKIELTFVKELEDFGINMNGEPNIKLEDGEILCSSNRKKTGRNYHPVLSDEEEEYLLIESGSDFVGNSRKGLEYNCFTEKEMKICKYSEGPQKSSLFDLVNEVMECHITQKEKRIFIRTLLFTMLNPEENTRILVEEVISILPFILKKQRMYTKENIEKVENLNKKWRDNRSNHLFPTINLVELESILDDFNIDKSEITLVPDLVNAGIVVDINRAGYNTSVFINSSYGALVSACDLCFYMFECSVNKFDWSILYHCGHVEPFGMCMCGLKQEIIKIFRRIMENENDYRPVAYYQIYSKQIGRYLKENIFLGYQSSLHGLNDKVYGELISLRILLDDVVLGSRDDRFRSDKQRKKARKAVVEMWRIKTALSILSCTVFFGSKDLDIYSFILKRLAFKIPLVKLNDQQELENLVIYGDGFISKCDINRNFEEFKKRKEENQLFGTAEDVFMDVFDDIRNGTVLKNVIENRGLMALLLDPKGNENENEEEEEVMVRSKKKKNKEKSIKQKSVDIPENPVDQESKCSPKSINGDKNENGWKDDLESGTEELKMEALEAEELKMEALEAEEQKIHESSTVQETQGKNDRSSERIPKLDEKEDPIMLKLRKEIEELHRSSEEKYRKRKRNSVRAWRELEENQRMRVMKLEEELSQLEVHSKLDHSLYSSFDIRSFPCQIPL